jgi:predicted nucleic acid-binding protein
MPVLDASVYVAVLSPYEEHHEVACRLCGAIPEDERFVVPVVFRIDVISALARRGESDEVLEAVDVLVGGPKFERVALETALLDASVRIARAAKLRAYDALYAGLALERQTPLFTLDNEIARRIRRARADIEVRTR